MGADDKLVVRPCPIAVRGTFKEAIPLIGGFYVLSYNVYAFPYFLYQINRLGLQFQENTAGNVHPVGHSGVLVEPGAFVVVVL